MANPLIPQKPTPIKLAYTRRSAGILDDYAVRKNVATKEGTIEHIPTDDNHITNKKYVDNAISSIDLSGLVPYTGATGNVDLGVNDLNVGGTFAVGTDKFIVDSNGKIGIGTTTPLSMLNIHQSTTGLKGLMITGYGLAAASPSSTEGVAVILNYNGENNRQLILGATDAIGSPTKGMFRFLTGTNGYASLDAVSGDGANRLLTVMGTDTTNVGVGYSAATGTGADYKGRLNVFTSTNSTSRTNLLIKKFGTASGNYIDVKNSSDISLFTVDFSGNTKITTDNGKLYFGAANDASINYDGANLIINPKRVGSGILDVAGTLQTDGYNSADGSAGITTTFVDGDGNTIGVKDGLIVSKTAP